MENFLLILKKISKKYDNKIFLVGEYIRDFLLGVNNKNPEICFVTNDLERVVKDLTNEMNIDYEKKDSSYIFKIKDLTIKFRFIEKPIKEYLMNKNFTINSMAIDIKDMENLKYIDESLIIDPFNGAKDIESEIIKLNKESILKNNPSLILKLVKYMTKLRFKLNKDLIDSIKKNRELLYKLDKEIIRDELFEILKLKNSYYYLTFMDEKLNILNIIFPEIEDMKEVGKCKYHVLNCYKHSIYTLKIVEDIIYADGFFEDHLREKYEQHFSKRVFNNRSRVELVKLGALLHDSGKPLAKWVDKTGRTRFKGHEITGLKVVDDIYKRLKLSERERDILRKIVSKHMIPLNSYIMNDVSGKTLYNIFCETGNETFDILLIALADIVSTRKLLDPNEEMGKYKVHIEYMANNYLTRYKEVEDISDIIDYRDIIDKFSVDKKKAKDIIKKIKKAIYLGKIKKRKKEILLYIEDLLN
ncbi:MAG: HD domain-containing protein [Firmicutes bacterium]|nr:HD domain-containing protein [Bacillota bacterium]